MKTNIMLQGRAYAGNLYMRHLLSAMCAVVVFQCGAVDGDLVITNSADDPYVVDNGATVQATGAVRVGDNGQPGNAIVKGGATLGGASFYVGANSSSGARSNYAAHVIVSNATVKSDNTISFQSNALNDGSAVRGEVFSTLTLLSGGIAKACFDRNDDPTARVIFDGGRMVPNCVTTTSPKYNYAFSSRQNGRLEVEARNGHDIDVETPNGKSIYFVRADTYADVRFLGTGGVYKRGSGTLYLGYASHAIWDLSGDFTLAEGTLKADDDDAFPSGEGKGVLRQLDGTFNLNSKDATFNDYFFWSGSFAGGGTLSLGADGRDFALKVPMSATDADFKKVGAGDVTFAVRPPKTVIVSEGALKLGAGVNTAYRRYRFKVLKTSGAQSGMMQIAELKLLCDGEDVTRPYESVGQTKTGIQSDAKEGPAKCVDGDLTTKFLDKNFYDGSFADECYVELAYAQPVKVTHYTWATGNDMYDHTNVKCRQPKAFQLLGSDDGKTWVVLDERNEYYAPSTAKTWIDDEFALGGADLAASTDVKLKNGATISAMSKDACIGTLEIDELAGSVSLPAGARLSVCGSIFDARTLTGSGKLELNPTGNAVRYVPSKGFSGMVSIKKGTAQVGVDQNSGVNAKFFKLTIRQTRGVGASCVQMSEFALYSTDGTRQNTGLSLVSPRSASQLEAGTCCAESDYPQGSAEGFDKLFDDNTGTKWCANQNDMSQAYNDPSRWRTVYLRLSDTASPIVGYNFATANDDPNRTPTHWSLFASEDGKTWFPIDARIGQNPTKDYKTWFNGGTPYVFNGACESLGNAIYAVSGGATLNVQSGLEMSGLVIDYSADTAAIVENFKPAQNGILQIQNVPAGMDVTSSPLPIRFPSALDVRSARKWKVFVDGKEESYRLIIGTDGTASLEGKGLVLFVR